MGKDEFDTLTLRGVKQAEEAAEKLKSKNIRAIYCSTAKRCEQSLDEILKVKEEMVPIHISRLLRPKTKKEKLEELQRRVKLFLADLECETEKDDEVLIISHLPIVKMFEYEIEGKADFWENGEIRELNYSK
jgi:broad specificity phosphatase PhoE